MDQAWQTYYPNNLIERARAGHLTDVCQTIECWVGYSPSKFFCGDVEWQSAEVGTRDELLYNPAYEGPPSIRRRITLVGRVITQKRQLQLTKPNGEEYPLPQHDSVLIIRRPMAMKTVRGHWDRALDHFEQIQCRQALNAPNQITQEYPFATDEQVNMLVLPQSQAVDYRFSIPQLVFLVFEL
ncbi:hypothetical protein AN958_04799 [Leucoagaricus sp. SymC.cos]|nr:hypothetical protein AN958_04799 [Leucoagaricus sp. SymC.cos]